MKTGIHRAVAPLMAGVLALSAAAPAVAQGSARRSVPQNTVVRVKLADALSSRTSRVGDRFMARLSDRDYSGFPQDTRFEGTVTQVQRPTASRPGLLDMKVHRAIMPDGRMVAATAFLASLDDGDVTRVGRGRLESRTRSRGDRFDWKWVGYGAAGGAVLGEIFGGSFLKGALLGGLGGAVYSYINRDKGRRGDFRDVELERGQEFGIRLHEPVVFNDNRSYRYARYEEDDSDDRYRHRSDVEERRTQRDRDYEGERHEDDRYQDRDRYEDERHEEDRYDRERDDRDRDERERDDRDRDERYERGRRPAR